MSERKIIDFIKEKERLLSERNGQDDSDQAIRPVDLALRDYHAPEELKRRTLAAMDKLAEEKRARDRRRGRVVKRVIATAAILALVLACTPFGGMVVSAAESFLGRIFGTYTSRVIDISGECYKEPVAVDYGNGEGAVLLKIGNLNQYVNIGDFEIEFGKVMVCQNVGLDDNADGMDENGESSSYDGIYESNLLMPVRVTHCGPKTLYGGYMPGFQLQFTVAGYKDGKKAVEFAMDGQGLYSEAGDEIYPVREREFGVYNVYPTHFINGKPTPKNSFLFKCIGGLSYFDSDLLLQHYEEYLASGEQMRDYIWGNNDWYQEEKKNREKDSAARKSLSDKERENIRKKWDTILRTYESLDGGWYYDGESEQYFSAYDAVMAIQPDRFVVTSVTLLTDKISGYTVSKKNDPDLRSTGYGIYNERYYVNWKNTQEVWYYILNKDYQDDLSDADLLNETDQAQSWEAVPFYDSADSSGRKKHF